jgi:glycosyltransferase involved in cell wall biosynthesis
MRILVANTFVGIGAGGQERVALDLAVGLHQLGHKVVVLGPYSRSAELRRGIPSSVALFEAPWTARTPGSESQAALYRWAMKIIHDQQIDIVSGHGRMIGIYFACRLAGIPLVWTLHGADPAQFRPSLIPRKCLARELMKVIASDHRARIVAVSEFTRTSFKTAFGDPPAWKVSTILNGLGCMPALAQLLEPRFGHTLRLGYVGRIEAMKGLYDFVPLCQQLTRMNISFTLRLFGDGSEERRLKQALDFWIQNGCVSFDGYEGDARKIYSSFDVLVHTAKSEWLGMSIIESQAAARIPVAYRSGGVPEVITHAESGLMVPPGDIESLAAAIASLHRNPTLASRMALCARDSASSRFSLDRMCKEYEKVFEELSGRNGEHAKL